MKAAKQARRAELQARVSELSDILERARCALYAQRTPETIQAYKDAWNAHSAAVLELNGPRKTGSYACRAGKRQAAEREAMRLDALRRRYR